MIRMLQTAFNLIKKTIDPDDIFPIKKLPQTEQLYIFMIESD